MPSILSQPKWFSNTLKKASNQIKRVSSKSKSLNSEAARSDDSGFFETNTPLKRPSVSLASMSVYSQESLPLPELPAPATKTAPVRPPRLRPVQTPHGVKNIAVFGTSANLYALGVAEQVGQALAAAHVGLVFGGAPMGNAMGRLCEANLSAGGHAVGILPGTAAPYQARNILTVSAKDSLQSMWDLADAVIVLPGDLEAFKAVVAMHDQAQQGALDPFAAYDAPTRTKKVVLLDRCGDHTNIRAKAMWTTPENEVAVHNTLHGALDYILTR